MHISSVQFKFLQTKHTHLINTQIKKLNIKTGFEINFS